MQALITTTVSAQEVPVIINQETGGQVDLTRPYWNANVDIANRRIQCDHFLFDEESAVYVKMSGGGHPSNRPWLNDGEFFHNPMSEGYGAATVDHAYLADYIVTGWGVKDGLYVGTAPLGYGFVELVTYNALGNTSENNAVRNWYASQDKGTSYHVCYDLDGAPLIPTGSAEIGNTDLLPEQNFTFQLPNSDTPVTEVPEIVRLDTGEPVEFVRAEFDFNEDLRGKRMNCGPFEWNEQYGYVPALRGSGAGSYYTFDYAYAGGDRIPFTFGFDDAMELSSDGAIDRFLQAQNANFIEVVASGYNVWGNSTSFFKGCRLVDGYGVEGLEPFAPNRILLTPQDSCDYSTADQYDGWGWNAATQEGCPPENNANSAMDNDSVDEQGGTDNSVSNEQADNANGNESEDTVANNTGDQSNDSDDDPTETNTTDNASITTGNGSDSIVSAEDQSDDNTPAPTSGAGAADRFLLLILICFLGRKRSKVG